MISANPCWLCKWRTVQTCALPHSNGVSFAPSLENATESCCVSHIRTASATGNIYTTSSPGKAPRAAMPALTGAAAPAPARSRARFARSLGLPPQPLRSYK
jgi:hypothetical protein